MFRVINRNFKFIKLNKQVFSDDILPEHLKYNIPKYDKNPENLDFPWLINGAPMLEMKVYKYNYRLDSCLNKYSSVQKFRNKKS